MNKPSNGDARTAADEAGLHYVMDQAPGLNRRRTGKTFVYRDASNRVVKDRPTLQRIRSLAIPPAWEEVWICPSPNGHIQATGRDQRGRKQFRYHTRWRTTRDGAKFSRTIAFGHALPRIRRRVIRDLSQPGLGREKVLATMVRLLERTLIRIGNEEYLRHNRSVGLSTMRDRHVAVKGAKLHFSFRGKGGKHHQIDLEDPRIAKIVRRVQDLPGQELFQYLDPTGAQQNVSSTDVNAYLREVAGEEFSAKDFRTWAGTVTAAVELSTFQRCEYAKEARRNLSVAIERVARRLGNTPTICRRCYIHPFIMESYLRGSAPALPSDASRNFNDGAPLTSTERAVLRFLQQGTRAARTRSSLATLLRLSLRKRNQGSRSQRGERRVA